MLFCSQPTNYTKMLSPNEKQTIRWCMWYSRTESKVWRTIGLCITSSLSGTDSEGNFYSSALNLQANEITIPWNSDTAYFKFLPPQQSETLMPIDPQLLTLAKLNYPDDYRHEVNQLVKVEKFNADSQPTGPRLVYKKF